MRKHLGLYMLVSFVLLLLFSQAVFANNYVIDTYFTVPSSLYTTDEAIPLKGYVYFTNYTDNGTLVSASAPLANANVNLTIRNRSGTQISNYTLTTTSGGNSLP